MPTDDFLGKPVVSGLGEELGLVVDVERWPSGGPKRLVVRESDGHERRVRLEHVRAVTGERVELKGPREGFHITTLRPRHLE